MMMTMIAIMASVSASKYCRGTRAVNKCLRSYLIGGSLNHPSLMFFVDKSPKFSTLSSNTVSYRVSTPLISIVGAHNKREALVASSSGHCEL